MNESEVATIALRNNQTLADGQGYINLSLSGSGFNMVDNKL
jgi:hypothetical protein